MKIVLVLAYTEHAVSLSLSEKVNSMDMFQNPVTSLSISVRKISTTVGNVTTRMNKKESPRMRFKRRSKLSK